jgi:predicted DNA-binding transcriptional regulator YafY
MKINRLLEITLLLLNKGTVTARELAERFEVSMRTIYRDIDILSSAGVPVYTNKVRGGGISLLENYTFSKALVTERERDGLLLALKTLQATRYPDIEGIINKIGALFKDAAAGDWVHVDLSPWGSSPNENNKFVNARRAILESKVISFDYISAEGVKSSRSVEPMQLVFKGQAWYLWGYCRRRRDFRTFRISRIRNLVVTGEKYQRREVEVNRHDDSAKHHRWVTLKLKFQPEVLYRLYDDYDETRLVKNPDGTYETIMTLPEDDWVYGHILSFGNSVEVLEPSHIRDIIREKLARAAEFYARDS